MAWVAIGSAVIGAAGAVYSSSQNAKAAKAAAAGAKGGQLDIDKLITDARTAAAENYKNSFALEQQYNPAGAALRGDTNLALANMANGNTAGAKARDSLLSSVTGEPNSLLAESADSILKQLSLGGSLSAETQNAVVRGALSKGGAAGMAGSMSGRGLVARDLGLTSLALQQQRQQQALAAGQALSTDALGRFSAAQTAANSDAQRAGLLASIIDARALPESGLSPGSIADVTIGDRNTQNQMAADRSAALAKNRSATLNSLLGFGSSALQAYLGSSGKSGSPTSTPTGGDGYGGF